MGVSRIMRKNKTEWLYQLRKCKSISTLEMVAEHSRYKLSTDELETFNSAADHRMAELTMNKLYDKVPQEVWYYVK